MTWPNCFSSGESPRSYIGVLLPPTTRRGPSSNAQVHLPSRRLSLTKLVWPVCSHPSATKSTSTPHLPPSCNSSLYSTATSLRLLLPVSVERMRAGACVVLVSDLAV